MASGTSNQTWTKDLSASRCTVHIVNSNSRTSNCHCSLLAKKTPVIRIFCLFGWLTVPVNPDKWSYTVIKNNEHCRIYASCVHNTNLLNCRKFRILNIMLETSSQKFWRCPLWISARRIISFYLYHTRQRRHNDTLYQVIITNGTAYLKQNKPG